MAKNFWAISPAYVKQMFEHMLKTPTRYFTEQLEMYFQLNLRSNVWVS